MTSEERKVMTTALRREMAGYVSRHDAAKDAGDDETVKKYAPRIKACADEIKKYAPKRGA